MGQHWYLVIIISLTAIGRALSMVGLWRLGRWKRKSL